jgi:hypothetical protein
LKQVGGLTKYVAKLREVIQSGKKIGGKRGVDVITQLFGRKEAQKALFRLTDRGFGDLVRVTEGMGDAASLTEDKFANMSRRTGSKVQQLKVGFAGLFTELGGGLVEGLGVEAAGPEDIAAKFEAAGKKVRSGAKNFAQGFIQALVPAGDLANTDFDSMAKSAGTAFGKLISGLGKLTSFAIRAAEKIAAIGGSFIDLASDTEGFAGGDTKVDKRQRQLGLQEIKTAGEQGVFGTGAGADLTKAATGIDLGELDKGLAKLRAIKFAQPALTQRGTFEAPKHIETDPLLLLARANMRSQRNAAAKTEQAVSIGLEATVVLKGEAAKGATMNVKATPKKGNVKTGKVGKRTVGS